MQMRRLRRLSGQTDIGQYHHVVTITIATLLREQTERELTY